MNICKVNSGVYEQYIKHKLTLNLKGYRLKKSGI